VALQCGNYKILGNGRRYCYLSFSESDLSFDLEVEIFRIHFMVAGVLIWLLAHNTVSSCV
jgi:hypothetical protein